MKGDSDETIVVATLSIVMYGSLAIICFYQAYLFWKIVTGKIEGGLYSQAKLAFFVVLGISATLELPTFMGCLVKGGPYGCVWDEDGTHDLVWCAHLIATCGFMYSVTSTAILWSDVIQLKDGNFFNSKSPLDRTKVYFRSALGIYCAIVLSTMVAVMIEHSVHNDHGDAHAHSKELGAIAYCLVPIMLVSITCGCFYCGTQLQQHVVRVKLDTPMLKKILFNLNLTMFVISTSYIMRALLVLSLYAPIPNSYSSSFKPFYHYGVWIPITQWFPYWFCSLCLVEQMRFKPMEHRPDSITMKNLAGLQLNELARTISKDSTVSSDMEARSSTGTGRTAHTSTDEATRVARTLSFLLSQVDEHGSSGVRTSASGGWQGGRFAGVGWGGLEAGSTDERDRESRDRTSTGSTSYFDRLSGGGGAAKPDHFFAVSALHSRASGAFNDASDSHQ